MEMFRGSVVIATLGLLVGTSVPASNTDAQTPGVVIVQPSQPATTYPEGRYELRGDGTARSPYYWVWIPTGVQSVPPPPPIGTVSSAPAGFQSGLKSAEGQIDHVGYLGRSLRLSDGRSSKSPIGPR